jgi:hypothetical protein
MLPRRAGHAHAVTVTDTKQKESAWWKPALSSFVMSAKVLGLFIAVLSVSTAIWFAWAWFRPDHLFNPINRFAHQRLMECRQLEHCPIIGSWSASMVPEVFEIGEPRDEVLARLQEAGYSLHGTDGDRETYRLDGAGSISPFECRSDFFIDLFFDQSGGLAEATSTGYGACL